MRDLGKINITACRGPRCLDATMFREDLSDLRKVNNRPATIDNSRGFLNLIRLSYIECIAQYDMKADLGKDRWLFNRLVGCSFCHPHCRFAIGQVLYGRSTGSNATLVPSCMLSSPGVRHKTIMCARRSMIFKSCVHKLETRPPKTHARSCDQWRMDRVLPTSVFPRFSKAIACDHP